MALLNNQFCINLSDNEDELSTSYDDGVGCSEISNSENLCEENVQNVGTDFPEWQFNVVVKFNLNPTKILKFEEDSTSKRVIVSETPVGLHFLKGLPILSAKETYVRNLNPRLLEMKLESMSLPMVLKFGAEPLDDETYLSYSDIPTVDDHICYLGETSTIRFDHQDQKEDSAEFLPTLPEEQSEATDTQQDVEIVEVQNWQPLSYDGAQGIQSTWSKKCQKRAKIITELLDTEKSYIKGLEVFNNQFLKPYVQPLKKVNLDIGPFQTNIENLIRMHDELYRKFCCEENICSVFKTEFKLLRMYKTYIEDYRETYAKLKDASKKRGFTGIFKNGGELISINPVGWFQARGITLVQRPPRYELLVKELLHNTPIGHPMYKDLEEGFQVTKRTCGDINEFQRMLLNEAKLVELSAGIDSKSLRQHGINQLVDPARRLVRSGKVALKKTRHPYLKRMSSLSEPSTKFELGEVLMCNDILIIMYGKKNFVRRVFLLEETETELNKEPIKSSNQGQTFEALFEIVLSKRSEAEIKKMYSLRKKDRHSLQTGSKSSGLVRLSMTSLDSGDTADSFSIFFSSMEEAEDWEKAIVAYSNIVYCN